MKKKVWLIGVFGSFALVILFILFLARTKTVIDLESAWIMEPVKQKETKRIWKKIEFKETGTSEELIDSDKMIFGPDNNIYVADLSLFVIKKYDITSKFIISLGKGEGRGPGEFLDISNIRTDTFGNVWALDPFNSRVTILYPSKPNEWKIIEIPFIPLNIIPLHNDKYLLEERFDGHLRRYTISGKVESEFDRIVDDQSLWSAVLYSRYTVGTDQSIIAVQHDLNNLIRYSGDGKIQYFRKPIDPPDYPKIDPYYANEVGKVNSVDYRTWKQVSRDVFTVGSSIHVFIIDQFVWHENSVKSRKKIMDVYDIDTGDYLYSYNLPEQLQTVAVSETHLAGISEELGKLVIWEVEEGWNQTRELQHE